MSSASFSWNGPQIEDEVHNRLRDQMHAFARDVVQRAEQFAPKRTGRLATSIGYDWNDASLTVVFTVGAPYGIFQEYGTRNMPPHPYLRPAINAVGPMYGYNVEMAFLNTPEYHQPVLAVGSKFAMPNTLSHKQKAQIRSNEARSKYFYGRHENVAHIKAMHARRRYF